MKFLIARDKEGELFLYRVKQVRHAYLFVVPGNYGMMRLADDVFPEITWENSPQEVELKLINQ